MEQFLQEYGSIIIAILAAIAVFTFVMVMCKEQGVLYQFVTFYCEQVG